MSERASGSDPTPIVIGIPTYRRRERLARLLASLEPSLATHPGAEIVVSDNACEDDTRILVEAFARRWPNTRYIAVKQRGISANRNAIIGAFLATPDARWLAMLDDDLAAGPDWLAQMLKIGRSANADVVSGPYAYTGDVASFVVRTSFSIHRKRRESGPCPPFHMAGNILLARRLLEDHPELRFDDDFGLSGGEDYDFFSRAADRGARFAWCDEAFCEEEVDANRLRPRAVAFRYFSSGVYMAVADRRRRGRARIFGDQARLFFRSAALAGIGAVTADRVKMLRGSLYLLIASGGLASLAGYRAFRYR